MLVTLHVAIVVVTHSRRNGPRSTSFHTDIAIYYIDCEYRILGNHIKVAAAAVSP